MLYLHIDEREAHLFWLLLHNELKKKIGTDFEYETMARLQKTIDELDLSEE